MEYSDKTVPLLSEADNYLGRLAGIGQLLPNPHVLIQPYIRQEAVLSSRIEGTRASLSDLFLYEITNKEPKEYMHVREVRNYVDATVYALSAIRKRPISLSLMGELHKRLLKGVRGADRRPGNFREGQNWIGFSDDIEEAEFVPPRPEDLGRLLLDFEGFIQNPPKGMPSLIQCALMHYQFETLHPFFDGNGRIGRLLITLFLCKQGLMPEPLLYLSGYMEKHREEYSDKLMAVRANSDYAAWVDFFLKAVAEQSRESIQNVEGILKLQKRYHDELRRTRGTVNAERLVDYLFINPYITAKNAAEYLKVTFPTAQSTIRGLQDAGILKEYSDRKRNRIYVADGLIRALKAKY
ncbi:MAG: Fic family protein [Candidatus Altiarchaeota archaeon]|nr:Fic family protein [Candidatus Altiarchaeota archaeon]